MTIIKIDSDSTGAHESQTYWNNNIKPMEGWAVVPEEMLPLENFPFGEIKTTMLKGVPTVTEWNPLPQPETGPSIEPTYTADDLLSALLGTL